MIVVDKDQFQSLAGSIANARAYYAQTLGDIPGTLKYTQQARDLLPEDDYMKRAIPTAMLGFVHWSKGDLDAAQESFMEIVDSFQKAGDISATISLSSVLADIKKAQGRFQETAGIYEKSLKLATELGEPVPMGTEEIYRGISELYLERGDLEAASEYLHRSEELSMQTLSTDWNYRLCLTQARLKESQGDLDGALDQLDKAKGLFFISPMPDLSPVAALKTRVWIRQGKLAEALNWAHERDLSYDDDLSYLHEFEHLILARILIARYKNEQKDRLINEALELLERLLEAARDGERKGSMIDILVQQALAYEAQDKISAGLGPLEYALTLAQAEGYFRTFVEEGIPMAKLLSKALENKIIPDYVGSLLAAIEAESQKQ
jgi:LuxR family maltose regulon positive regulatory protein